MYKRTSIDLHMTDGAHLLKLQQSLLEGSKAELCLLGACKCPVKVPACGIAWQHARRLPSALG